MGKSTKDISKSDSAKKAKATVTKKSAVGGGFDELDSLFAQKKQSSKDLKQQISEEKESAKQERKQRKQARMEEEADNFALRGSGAAGATVGATVDKGDAKAPTTLHGQAKKLSNLTYTRADVEQLNDSTKKETKNKWASDRLGGVFNGEGFTGRQDGGQRVFKVHLMNKKGYGESPGCPFDCDCCFI